MKIDNKDDKANTGRLHVDYAQARDDFYEWECQQRAQEREMRHYYRIEQERLRPPSPPPVAHFSDHEAQILLERLKGAVTLQVIFSPPPPNSHLTDFLGSCCLRLIAVL